MAPSAAKKYVAAEFMSRELVITEPQSSVKEAVDLMVESGVGSVIVARGRTPLGLLTERDVLRALAKEKRLDETKAGDVMTIEVNKIAPTLGSWETAQEMTKRKGRLLVFEDERMAGIITASDIVKVIYRTGATFEIDDVLSRDLVKVETNTPIISAVKLMNAKGVGSVLVSSLSVPQMIFTERDLLNKALFLELDLSQEVGMAATLPLVTAELGIDGGAAAGAMVDRRIKRLPLTKGGKVVGMVTARDLVQAYAYPSGVEGSEAELQGRARYGEICPICNSRIDANGLCACGAGGE